MAVHLAACVVLAFCITGFIAVEWEAVHVKYDFSDGFFNIPLTVDDIKKENFVKMAHDNEHNADLYSLPNDPRVSIMFDSYGNIAGIRTAYIKSDVDKNAKAKGIPFPYSYDNKPIFKKGNYYGIDLWYTSVLFINPQKLKSGGRREIGGKIGEDMYMKLGGKWTMVPSDECKAESVGFVKQSCFIGMGMQYFYKLTPDLKCENYEGAFLLYEKGELIGLGFNPFGTFTSKDRVWFENVPPNMVTKIVTNGPACVKVYVENYGNSGFHIFFKKFPRYTLCIWPWQRDDLCTQNVS